VARRAYVCVFARFLLLFIYFPMPCSFFPSLCFAVSLFFCTPFHVSLPFFFFFFFFFSFYFRVCSVFLCVKVVVVVNALLTHIISIEVVVWYFALSLSLSLYVTLFLVASAFRCTHPSIDTHMYGTLYSHQSTTDPKFLGCIFDFGPGTDRSVRLSGSIIFVHL
jgi:hypothetical protein